jgi:glycosyltransferase involved in cell wall biosynthesis
MNNKISVLIPTYNRPDILSKCLEGIAKQQLLPHEIVIIVRPTDQATIVEVKSWERRLPIRLGFVEVPGVVQAMNVGVKMITGDIVTFTDDDTIAYNDWLVRILHHFEDNPTLGGLGGRDVIAGIEPNLEGQATFVGKILPYGRITGNHHLGFGEAREVDHLKGVNMSFRMQAVEGCMFDTSLRGSGAQVYFELAFSLEVLARGWKIVYDPNVQVQHFPGPRFDEDKRSKENLLAAENAAYNLYYAVRRYMPSGVKKFMTLLWLQYIGSFGHPGALSGLLFFLSRNRQGTVTREVTKKAWDEAKLYARKHRTGFV